MSQRTYITTGDRVKHLKSGIEGVITKHIMWNAEGGRLRVELDSPWKLPWGTPRHPFRPGPTQIIVRADEVEAV